MARTVLVPTDLQVGSLNALKSYLQTCQEDRVNVVLMHAVLPPTGITELLFHSPQRELNDRIGPAFEEALAVLGNRFEQHLATVRTVPFHGLTQAAFEQFMQGLGVDEIHLSTGYRLQLKGRAVDPMPFVRKSRLPVVEHGAPVLETRSGPVVDHVQLLFEQ